MARGFFVTGTDTGVGKTLVSLGLMCLLQEQGYSVAGMKPVASGCDITPEGLRNPDALALQARATVRPPYDQVNPYAYAAAVAPHVAAAEAGRHINIETIAQQFRAMAAAADYVVVEGVGGWKVPLNEVADVADLARTLGLPLVLVVAIRLGCVNHAILTWGAMQASGIPCAGWVANCMNDAMSHADENIAYLSARFGMPPAGIIPSLPEHIDLIERVSQTLLLNSQFV
jgi:dethiobiotin synthetase